MPHAFLIPMLITSAVSHGTTSVIKKVIVALDLSVMPADIARWGFPRYMKTPQVSALRVESKRIKVYIVDATITSLEAREIVLTDTNVKDPGGMLSVRLMKLSRMIAANGTGIIPTPDQVIAALDGMLTAMR